MPDERKELLRRFYLQLELIRAHDDRQAAARAPQRIGDLYDDADPSPWAQDTARPFLSALQI